LQSRVRIEKKGIRALGIAESFRRGVGGKAVLAGVVMRSDLFVDGVALSTCTVGGLDSTDAVLEVWQKLGRQDVNIMIIGGSVISWFNVVDLNKVHQQTNIPLICITYRESEGLDEVFMKRFPDDWETRLRIHKANGERKTIALKTGYRVFVRCFGIEEEQAKDILDKFTYNGRYPEPVRLAKSIARSVLNTFKP